MAAIMWEIDEILDFLKAGGWQSLKEVIAGCSLPECKARLVLNFLNQFNFIQMDEEKQKIKLSSNMLNFINQTEINHLNRKSKPKNFLNVPLGKYVHSQ
jgi:DNA-binding IclR family transcriptional regulator